MAVLPRVLLLASTIAASTTTIDWNAQFSADPKTTTVADDSDLLFLFKTSLARYGAAESNRELDKHCAQCAEVASGLHRAPHELRLELKCWTPAQLLR